MISIRKIQMIFTDMPENLQIILRFSPIFSTYLGFSSYLCSRNSAARKKGGGVIIFIKVLKNDAALPSEIDSRAFLLWGPAMESLGTVSQSRLRLFLPLYLFTFNRLSFKQIDYLTIASYSHNGAEYLLDKDNVLGFEFHVFGILAYLAGYPISTQLFFAR